MMSWEQYHQLREQSCREHHQGENWGRKKEKDQDRMLMHSSVSGTLRRRPVLLDNSQSSATKKWLKKKKYLTINTVKCNFSKKTGNMLYPVITHLKYQDTAWKLSKYVFVSGPYLDTFHAVRATVRVTPEVLSATEILSVSTVKRLVVEQGRFLTRE